MLSSTGGTPLELAQNYAQVVGAASRNTIKVNLLQVPVALAALVEGQGDLAVDTNPPQLYRLVNGQGEYQGKASKEMRVLWPTVPVYIHFMTLASFPGNTIADLKGKTIEGNLAGTNSDTTLNQFLTSAGYDTTKDLTIRRVGPSTNVIPDLKDGKTEVAFFVTSHPYSLISEFEIGKSFKFLEIPSSVTTKVNDKYYGGAQVYSPGTVKSGDYYQSFTKTVETPSQANVAVAPAKTNADLIYELTKIFWENKADLESRFALAKQVNKEMIPGIIDPAWPLHEGAARYYKEKGWIK